MFRAVDACQIWFQFFQLQELVRQEDSNESPEDKSLVVEVPLGSRSAVFNFSDDLMIDDRNLSNDDRSSMKVHSGAATRRQGFVKCFLKVPQAVGLYCSCHAAQASKANLQKTYNNTFSTSNRPRL